MNFRFRMPVTQVSLPSHDPGMNPPQPALDEALENVYTVCVVTPPWLTGFDSSQQAMAFSEY